MGCFRVPEGRYQTCWWPEKAVRERNALDDFGKYEQK